MTDLIEANPGRWDISCLHNIVVGGSTMTADIQRRMIRVIGAKIQQVYGCTETGLITSGDEPDVKLGSAGRVVPFVNVTVR